ncbi:MAG: endonuclease/exonuclease/phosphatase family protein [Salinibacterium sp.]|nr:endonuclease/exonuclease/phosphatase family protein [Salinibacterium sp.]
MFRRFLAAVVIVAVAAALLVVLWPQVFGLASSPVIAQVVSLRGLGASVALVLVVALTLAALISGAVRRFAASLAICLLVFTLVTAAVLSTRGFGNPGFESATDNDVTVLSWNTLGDAPGAGAIAALALETGAEVVVLPETTRETGLTVAGIMGEAGKPMGLFTTHYDEVSKARSTTVLISVDLGEYEADESLMTTSVLPSIVATPVDGTGPTIIAVHAVAPIPGEMAHWRSDLQWLSEACAGDNVIMAGDFNSTLDYYSGLATDVDATLGGCADAADATGNAAVGTWPAVLPALLGAPIDHVMTTPNWRITGFRVIQSHDGDGSDHRPILAQLSPAN